MEVRRRTFPNSSVDLETAMPGHSMDGGEQTFHDSCVCLVTGGRTFT
jgi:hypothetical protein